MIYITGDTHGQFERIEAFCQRFRTNKDDVMIILGDGWMGLRTGWIMRSGTAGIIIRRRRLIS